MDTHGVGTRVWRSTRRNSSSTPNVGTSTVTVRGSLLRWAPILRDSRSLPSCRRFFPPLCPHMRHYPGERFSMSLPCAGRLTGRAQFVMPLGGDHGAPAAAFIAVTGQFGIGAGGPVSGVGSVHHAWDS